MTSTLAAVLVVVATFAILDAPAFAVTRWVPLPASKASALDEARQPPDAGRGAVVYENCRACHDIGSNAGTRVGPDLTGVVGRPAASLEGYAYSEALHTAGREGLVWTRDLLDQYLAAPTKFLPGNKMAFVGLRDAEARRDLIAYLATFESTDEGAEQNETAPAQEETSAPEAAAPPPADQQP